MTTACLSSPVNAVSTPLSGASHRALVDAMRAVAIYGIVWLHAVRSETLEGAKALGRFAVPFFVLAAAFFVFEGIRRQPQRSFGEYVRSRVRRLYVPFLAWSGIYLAFKLAKAAVLPEQANLFPGWDILWAGGFYHLWFIPFILAVSVLGFVIAKATWGQPILEGLVGVAAVVEGILLALMPSASGGFWAGPYGSLVAGALPAACWAVALGILARYPAIRCLEHTPARALGLTLAVACTLWTWHAGSSRIAENLAGLGVMIIALGSASGVWVAHLAKLGPLAYGIYFGHLLAIKSFEAVATKVGWGISWPLDLVIFAGSALLSTLAAWALSQWRWTRWLVV